MKKGLIFIIAVFFAVSAASAQDQSLVSKRGISILPQKGDIAIGISATPFLNFAGNVTKINGTSAFESDAAWTWLTPNTIYGKYFLEDNMAIRGKLRISKVSNTTVRKDVNKSALTPPAEPEYVEDKWTRSTTNIALTGGIEKRRGYGRLQGFYGAEATISLLGGTKDTYEYGNAITSDFTSPARTNFNGNSLGYGWVTKATSKAVFGFGVGAFIGCEYFFAPKISIGGEFGWGVGINQNLSVSSSTPNPYDSGYGDDAEIESEYWDASGSGAVKTRTTPGGKKSSFSIDASQTSGNLFLLFYF